MFVDILTFLNLYLYNNNTNELCVCDFQTANPNQSQLFAESFVDKVLKSVKITKRII